MQLSEVLVGAGYEKERDCTLWLAVSRTILLLDCICMKRRIMDFRDRIDDRHSARSYRQMTTHECPREHWPPIGFRHFSYTLSHKICESYLGVRYHLHANLLFSSKINSKLQRSAKGQDDAQPGLSEGIKPISHLIQQKVDYVR